MAKQPQPHQAFIDAINDLFDEDPAFRELFVGEDREKTFAGISKVSDKLGFPPLLLMVDQSGNVAGVGCRPSRK